MRALRRKLEGAPPPQLAQLPGQGEYGVTYLLDEEILATRALAKELVPLAQAFHDYAAQPQDIILLCDLIDPDLDALTIRYLFAGVTALMRTHAVPGSALNPPIQPAQPLRSAFRLHADLFSEVMLMSVFDRVPDDGTGACVFLEVATLCHILEDLDSMPSAVKARLPALIQARTGVDHFDEVFQLLHDSGQPWVDELFMRTRAAQYRLVPRTGQGYVIHDRRWLHGREPQSCPVGLERLYRIVFDA